MTTSARFLAVLLGSAILGLGLWLAAACGDDDDGGDTVGDNDASDDDNDVDDDSNDNDDDNDDDHDDTTPSSYSLLSANGGGTFDGEYNEEDCPPYECDDNHAPTVEAPVFAVNGALVDDLDGVQLGDHVEVLMAYADADCNVACGSMDYSYLSPQQGSDSSGSLPSNLPCSTDQSGVYLGFAFDLTDPGEYSYALRVWDYCGSCAPRKEGSFSL